MEAVRRWAYREWGSLLRTVGAALAARRWRAVPLTLAAVLLTAAFQYVQNRSWGYGPVQDVGAVRAADAWWLALLRTPLSLFVPALDLPVWGALGQILLVFGVAEICLGRRRTLAVAYLATLAGTLYARLGIALGPDRPLGLPASDALVVDTGPSAAVVGLAVYVCVRHRARWTAACVVAAMAAECALKPNLAGREHLAAIVAVLVLCAAERLPPRQGRSRRSGSGVPPIRFSKPRPRRDQRRS
ncbi:hypothetical protein [Streptomyces sp. SID5785]|uniref:hypothetical protein n=1 Tax=Streptomyces sp. SID5785 TaxID=2690309 RepID=UPI00192667C2|nr:hypothetical protein [Streptomyces sp. SID5785]